MAPGSVVISTVAVNGELQEEYVQWIAGKRVRNGVDSLGIFIMQGILKINLLYWHRTKILFSIYSRGMMTSS